MTQAFDPEFGYALAALREKYGDSYGERVELGASLLRETDAPQSIGSEAVLMPVIRWQKIPACDVYQTFVRKVGEEDAKSIRNALVDFTQKWGERE